MSNSQLPIPTISLVNDRPATTSLAIAEHFEKNHKEVLRDIRSLIEQCPSDFTERNFALSEYTDSTGRKLPMYTVFFDGFILLVMGYTGKKALAMKLAYIEAFNAMRAKLEQGRRQELNQADAPIPPDQQCTLRAIVKTKINTKNMNKGQLMAAYQQIWSRFSNHFRLAKYSQLPQSRMSEAVAYLVNLEIRPAKKIAPAPEQKKLEAEEVITNQPWYEYKKRLFDQILDLQNKTENIRETIYMFGRAETRTMTLSTEKQVLLENLWDCVNGAVTGMNIAFYNLRSACRIGSRTDFCKW